MPKTTPIAPETVIAHTEEWLEKAVIGLNLCPFAKAVHVKKQIRYVVSEATTPEALLEQLHSELELLAETSAEKIDTTLLIHPHFQFDGTDLYDIENYTNRSPYPALHLLREESIDRAVEAFPDAGMIYEKNIETMQGLGFEGWDGLALSYLNK